MEIKSPVLETIFALKDTFLANAFHNSKQLFFENKICFHITPGGMGGSGKCQKKVSRLSGPYRLTQGMKFRSSPCLNDLSKVQRLAELSFLL